VGLPYIEGIVGGTNGKQVSVRFLVDSGATYTLTALFPFPGLGASISLGVHLIFEHPRDTVETCPFG